MLSASDYIFFDFDADPFCEAGVVDCSAGSVAFAGIKEEIVFLFGVIEAYFALVFAFSGDVFTLEDIFVEVGTGFGHGFGPSFLPVGILGDKVLDSS